MQSHLSPRFSRRTALIHLGALTVPALTGLPAWGARTPERPQHRFMAFGGETRLIEADGTVSWRYAKGTRDGWLLPNGRFLLAITRDKDFPGGGAVEVDRDGKVYLQYQGTQSEVDTVQRLPKGGTLVGEAGANPRLLELDADGRVVHQIPLTTQKKDTHLQQRMSRRLTNGNYLVPHLLDRKIREYRRDGQVVWEADTPHMPFTAIRLSNGHTIAGCTLGDLVVELDRKGKVVWQVTNDDLPGRPFNDCCGVQRLPNGNLVVTAHHAQNNEVKLVEINRQKQIVWEFRDGRPGGIHHFQILDTNGRPLKGPAMR